jgi:hypothetical protein
MWMNQDSTLWECCAAPPPTRPSGARRTGNLRLSAEHIPHLGHLVKNFIHANADEVGEVHVDHGRAPARAAPTPPPTMNVSEIGVSRTLPGN